jgi:iron complex outermembrane receptor protein
VRAGWTPGADEYVLTYIVQNGEKGAPPYAENIASRATFFDWPYYDKESIYANTRTVFGNGWTLKGRLFYDGFQNQLRRYDNANYTTQALPFAFTSNYDDYTFGGSAELNIPTSQTGALRVATFVKRDVHREFRPGGPVSKMRDITTSIAADYREELEPGLTATAGLSFDMRNAGRADNPSVVGTQFVVADQSAVNIQAGLEYALSDNIELFGGASRKSRFATMFERYSYRLGFGQPNPALEPETLTTLETGVRGTFASWLTGSASVFWGDADKYTQNVTIGFNPAPPFNAITQSQNIGNVRISGFEADLSANWDWLNARLSYGYLDRSLKSGATPLFGTPENKLDADVEAQLGHGFFAQGSFAYRDGFKTSDAGTGNPISSYSIAGLKGGWRDDSGFALEVAVQNVFDTLYEFDDGYPGAGRSVSLTLRHTL